MTSQKRYRHHESNSANRFRDIPPRFKRQKSSSSPKPVEDTNNQENQWVSQSTPLPEPVFTCGSETMTPLPSNRLDAPESGPSDNGWEISPNRASPHGVLTQLENLSSYPDPMWTSGPLAYQNPSDFPATPLYTWQPQQLIQSNPAYQQTMYSYQPLVTRNDCISPSLKMAQVRKEDPTQTSQAAMLRTVSPSSSSCSVSPGPSSTPDNQSRPAPDYSDPDIRTIEMLRELERVADEKEKEDENDPTIDRKNLVSHHLRMLMCAVDRYTEGVDDNPLASPNNNSKQKKTEASPNLSRGSNARSNSSSVHQPPTPRYMQHTPAEELAHTEGQWQMVGGQNPRKQSQGHNIPARSYTPHVRTPPPATSPVKTPPPSSMTGTGVSPMPAQPSHTASPQMQPRPVNGMYPLRAITRFNNDQGQAQLRAQSPQEKLSLADSSLNHTPPFSPAPSPPLKQRSVWGPMSMDNPADTRSWDLWSGPSFHSEVYGPPPMTQQRMVPPTANNFLFAQSVYPAEHCAPVDLKEHMPLYRR